MSKYVKQIFLNPIYDFFPLVALVVVANVWTIQIAVVISFILTLALFVTSFFLRNKIISWNIFVAVLLLILFASAWFYLPTFENKYYFFILPEIAVSVYLLFFVVFQKLIKKYLQKKNIVSTYCYFEEFYRLIKYFLPVFLSFVCLFFMLYKTKNFPIYLDTILIVTLLGIIVYEFVRVDVIRLNFLKEEWYPIVSQEGNVIGKIEKKESLSSEQKFLHPIIRVHIICNDMIYLQKRFSSDLIFPEKFDTAISNHVHFGETIDSCIVSSAKIRYGIKQINPIYLTKYEIETSNEKQLAFVYYTYQFNELKPLCSGISEGKFWPIKQVMAELKSGIFTENFIKEFDYLCSKSILPK